jgi:hypothetical protein
MTRRVVIPDVIEVPWNLRSVSREFHIGPLTWHWKCSTLLHTCGSDETGSDLVWPGERKYWKVSVGVKRGVNS